MGLAKNGRLNALTGAHSAHAAARFAETGEEVRRFTRLVSTARSRDRARWVIAKIEHARHGAKLCYSVCSLPGESQALYERLFCARRDMGDCTRQNHLDLSVDRTSCGQWWANQFRLLLTLLAYTLVETTRRVGFNGMHPSAGVTGYLGTDFPLNQPSEFNSGSGHLWFHAALSPGACGLRFQAYPAH
ncbi:MAG: transposase [Rhodospirillaceae bacterium]|nr:transposase [Rhodospirillaceae bacterium]